MSDHDTPPRFVWLTEGGDLSHHKPSDPTAVKYARADVMQDEVARLTADLAAARAERDGLATLRRAYIDGYNQGQLDYADQVSFAEDRALAALPPEEEAA